MRYFFSRPCARVLTCLLTRKRFSLRFSFPHRSCQWHRRTHTLQTRKACQVHPIFHFLTLHTLFFFFMILISSSHMLTHILRVTKRNKTMEVSFARRRSLSVSLSLSPTHQNIRKTTKIQMIRIHVDAEDLPPVIRVVV